MSSRRQRGQVLLRKTLCDSPSLLWDIFGWFHPRIADNILVDKEDALVGAPVDFILVVVAGVFVETGA